MAVFDRKSRYVTPPLEVYTVTDRRGRAVTALPMIEPPGERSVGEYVKKQGQRLDHPAGFVLAHGLLTERKVNLAEGGAGSALEILGQDRRREMDRVPRNHPHEGRASQIAERILRSYAFETDVTDTEIQYEEDKGTLNQTE